MAPPKKPDGERVRDIPPTGVRLPPELRDELVRAAFVHRISLNQEIVQRLRSTLSPEQGGTLMAGEAPPRSEYTELSATHRALLNHFQTLAPEKQLALLTLLKR